MFETFSAGVLLMIGIALFINVRNGTVGPWLKAKFLNQAAPQASTPPGGPGSKVLRPLPSDTKLV